MNIHSDTTSPDESVAIEVNLHSTGLPVTILSSIDDLTKEFSLHVNIIFPCATLVNLASVATTNILIFLVIDFEIANAAAPVLSSAPMPCTAQYMVLKGF